MLRLSMIFLVMTVGFSCASNNALAEQRVVHVGDRDLVVHDRAAPVIVHRVFPPFLGKHVSKRQLDAGRLPRGARR